VTVRVRLPGRLTPDSAAPGLGTVRASGDEGGPTEASDSLDERDASSRLDPTRPGSGSSRLSRDGAGQERSSTPRAVAAGTVALAAP
jgi:hypothetical protein